MPTPPKPFMVLKNEKKSHRTKAELKQREAGEKALASGVALKERPEVKANPVAHKEFLRLNKLLKNIEKNDAIYEPIINRYCMIQAECFDFEEKRERFYHNLEKLEEEYENQSDEELTMKEYFKLQNSMQGQIISLDKQVQTKRKMLLDIEKENIMTIAAALRSIPKKVDESENPLLKALKG
jgi:hypothetical protein